LVSIWDNTTVAHEIIVVDGGSEDTTVKYLGVNHPRIRVIEQGHRTGCISAVNEGCAVATGDYVAILNDDCRVLDPCLDKAVGHFEIDTMEEVGQVAIPFIGPHLTPKIDRTFPLAGRRWVYANFGVVRRTLGDQVGWWGTTHYQYGGDAELSLKIWNAGYKVVPLEHHAIHHLEVHDDTRIPNTDSNDFYRKWRQWKGPLDDNPIFTT
jgi:GT2 family glycosyltransferase